MIRLIIWDDDDPEDTRFSIKTDIPASQMWPFMEYIAEFADNNCWIGMTEGKARLSLIKGGIDESP